MSFHFVLPTTSILHYTEHLSSDSHPSLILAASTSRSVVRDALKRHKRLPAASQAANLNNILSSLNDYLPLLFALDAGLCGKIVSDEEIHVSLVKEIEVEWRPSLAASTAGREPSRVKGKSLDYELCFALATAAYVRGLLARSSLRTLIGPTLPSAEERKTIITSAINSLLEANSIHRYLVSRASEVSFPALAIDISASTQSALASLTIATATLCAVLKDDPWPALLAQDRSSSDREWMIKAPKIPKVRAHLFARLCLQAAEHAGKACALLASSKGVDEALLKYAQDVQHTAKAKACRFFGIDAEISGKTGEAIGWLLAGKQSLGIKVADESSKSNGLSKLKKHWSERREDKKVEKGVDGRSDGIRLEESRIIEMLEVKWHKTNDLITHQIVPAPATLLTILPLGRDIHTPRVYVPPSLDTDMLAKMRAPPDSKDERMLRDDNDDSDEESFGENVPGAFPGIDRAATDSKELYY